MMLRGIDPSAGKATPPGAEAQGTMGGAKATAGGVMAGANGGAMGGKM